METRSDFLKELMEAAPTLAKLPKVNAYQAPESYFQKFRGQMMETVLRQETESKPETFDAVLQSINKADGYAAPTNYFVDFDTKLLARVRREEVSEELNAAAPLLSRLAKPNTLQAPEGYFHTFSNRLQKKITAEERKQRSAPGWFLRWNSYAERWVSVFFKPKYTFVLAACAALMMMTAIVFVHVAPQPAAPNSNFLSRLETVSNADLEAYINAHADEFQKTTLEESIDDVSLRNENLEGNLSLENYIKNNISDQDLAKALMN